MAASSAAAARRPFLWGLGQQVSHVRAASGCENDSWWGPLEGCSSRPDRSRGARRESLSLPCRRRGPLFAFVRLGFASSASARLSTSFAGAEPLKSQSSTRFAGFRFVGTIVETDGTVDADHPFGLGPSGDAGSPFFFNEDASTNEAGAWDTFGSSNAAGGFTNTPQALQAAAHILSLNEAAGGPRDGAIKVVVLLTDGNPNRYWGTECDDIPEITGPGGSENVRDPNDVACTEYQAAKLINDYGAYLVVVRIGNNLDADFMEHCINQTIPEEQAPSIQQIQVASFAELQDGIDAIVDATCIDPAYATPLPVDYPDQASTCAASV